MFKIISAEFKKILSKPGIYVLSLLLAVILVLGVFIYNPQIQESKKITFTQTNFLDKYAYFIGDDDTNKTHGIKVEADNNVTLAVENINKYFINTADGKITQKQNIENLLKDISEKFKEYLDCSIDGLDSTIVKTRTDLVESLSNLNSAIVSANINAANGSYSILMTESTYNDYRTQYKEIEAWAKTVVKKEDLAKHCNIYKNDLKNEFLSTINDFVYPTLNDEFIKQYTTTTDGTKLFTLKIRLNKIMKELNENFNLSQSEISKNIQLSSKMDELAQDYVDTCSTFTELVKYELISNALSNLSTTEQMNVMYLSDYSQYNSKSTLIKLTYLFNEDKSERDFSNPLSIGVTSNDDINAYDYAYFVLRLFSFIIIAFAIMSACHTIAGEIKDGSMRYLAIRPVSRTKILLGKFASILILSTILSIFSAIIAVCVGGAIYGFNSMNILTIFNGTTVIIIHPAVMIVIYVVSMLLELTVYTSIAILLSCILKSDLLSVTLLLAFYLINSLLPVFVTGINSWLTFYPFAHINLYALFGSSLYSIQGNFLNALLGAKVYITTNIILTAAIIVLLISITTFIATKLFKKKEL